MRHLWNIRGQTLDLSERALVMGIVNVTPDSFSDGGRWSDAKAAIDHALALVAEGSDLLDIGGESTRPGSDPVSADEEIRRVLSVVEGLAKQTPVPLSIDTMKAEVARRCLDVGAHIINDVTALTGDPYMADVVRKYDAGAVLMHMQGTPKDMQENPRYDDVIGTISNYFGERLKTLEKQGIAPGKLALDPGIGFGKTFEHNMEILACLDDFARHERPVLLGVSRKGFLGQITGRPRNERAVATAAIGGWALARGTARIFRVHDVGAMRDVVRVAAAMEAAEAKWRIPH
ncbi:MAG: dihydropteroate synthase [Gemmataceae bacterium]